jgi:ABC-type transporter Mla subunit MlaD
MVMMDETRRKLIAVLAWLQLIVSLAFAVALIWGYATYHPSLGQFVRSLAASIEAVSTVVARSAETLEARGDVLNQSAQMLAETRKLINQLLVVAESQSKLAPQHAAGLQSVASITGKLGGLLQTVGDRMAGITVPSGLRFDGMKPIITMSSPMEEPAKEARAVAQDIKNVSESMATIATTVGRDGQTLSAGVIATSNQALKVIAEAEKTLERIKAQDLPKAIAEMKSTSQELTKVSAQVDMVSKGGVVLLGAGLILAVWCFLNSLGMLMLVGATPTPMNRPNNVTS